MVTAPSTERRFTAKGQATKARILEAATDLIARQGVARTTLDDVRRAANVSGSQMTHYFDSKQTLVSEVIARQANAAVGSQQPSLGKLDTFEALQAWADAAVEDQQRNGGRGTCSLGTLAGELTVGDDDNAVRTDIADGFLRWKQLIHDGLQAMLDRGELRPDADPERLSFALLSALQGGVLLSQTVRDSRPLRASLDATLDHIRSHQTAAA